MPQINLLPWRDELRRRRQKEFAVSAVIAAAVMAAVVFGAQIYVQGLIDHQKKRNQFIEAEIAKLKKQIEEIKDLKREKERLLQRTAKIQQLQGGRPDIVHLMDALVQTVPEGVYYSKIRQKGTGLTMDGVAQSNARVSSLMRRLDASEWLEEPKLLEIKKIPLGKDELVSNFSFTLTVKQTVKKGEGEQEGESS